MNIIKQKRLLLGLNPSDFARLLNIEESKLLAIEDNIKKPTKAFLEKIDSINTVIPYKKQGGDFKFIDLFAGIGGIRLPFQKLGGECVFTSEWDKHARNTYFANYGEVPQGDITKINTLDIPDHDILLGGFPCQTFSQAGKKAGFKDTRGTMFFEIQKILVNKKPKAFLLENVKQLKTHDKGNTLKTILDVLTGNDETKIPDDITMSEEAKIALSTKLNYWVTTKVLKAADFGVPQNRERIFIIGFNKDYFGENVDFDNLFTWPTGNKTDTKVSDILEQDYVDSLKNDTYTISDKLYEGHKRRKIMHEEKGNGFGFTLYKGDERYTNTLSARYNKDGSEILIDQTLQGKNPRKLTLRECARLQGFPEDFIIDASSKGQVYKQFGNSVCMKVIDAIASEMIKTLKIIEK